MLNGAGYGKGTGLVLDLVHNPVGAFLPGKQASLERDYRRELSSPNMGSSSITSTQSPTCRSAVFWNSSRRSGNTGCTWTCWSGRSTRGRDRGDVPYAPLRRVGRNSVRLRFQSDARLARRPRCTRQPGRPPGDGRAVPAGAHGPHCFGCTAGAGSSCGGALE
jgi:hypothetical protein